MKKKVVFAVPLVLTVIVLTKKKVFQEENYGVKNTGTAIDIQFEEGKEHNIHFMQFGCPTKMKSTYKHFMYLFLLVTVFLFVQKKVMVNGKEEKFSVRQLCIFGHINVA